ncbi:MAG: V4R domain-containing protein [Candidatus Bathyarchaeales archaeon]
MNLTDSDSTIDELVKEIRKIKGVENVQALHPVTEGLVADYIFTRLLLAGDRAIILRRPGYAGLITGIREQFGTAGETFLYYTGYESGIKYGKAHQEIAAQLGIKDPIDIMQKISIPLCTCMGLGKPEIIEATVNPPRVIVRLYDSFECELGPLAKRPFSNFFRGILAGLVAHLFSRKMDAKELKCIAKGDPHCEFKITPE